MKVNWKTLTHHWQYPKCTELWLFEFHHRCNQHKILLLKGEHMCHRHKSIPRMLDLESRVKS